MINKIIYNIMKDVAKMGYHYRRTAETLKLKEKTVKKFYDKYNY